MINNQSVRHIVITNIHAPKKHEVYGAKANRAEMRNGQTHNHSGRQQHLTLGNL
jgi:hypothetical protein